MVARWILKPKWELFSCYSTECIPYFIRIIFYIDPTSNLKSPEIKWPTYSDIHELGVLSEWGEKV